MPTQAPSTTKTYLKISEAAREGYSSDSHLRDLIRRGALTERRFGSNVKKIRRDELEALGRLSNADAIVEHAADQLAQALPQAAPDARQRALDALLAVAPDLRGEQVDALKIAFGGAA